MNGSKITGFVVAKYYSKHKNMVYRELFLMSGMSGMRKTSHEAISRCYNANFGTNNCKEMIHRKSKLMDVKIASDGMHREQLAQKQAH